MKNNFLTFSICFMLLTLAISVPGLFNESIIANPENNFETLDITLTIEPFNPPIIIPNAGGNFRYKIEASNNQNTQLYFDIWTTYTYPNNTISNPQYGPVSFLIQDGWTTYQENITQIVESELPYGNYSYNVYIGNYSNDTVWYTDNFTFEKLSEEAGWYPQVPNIDEQLTAVSFPDSEHGWAVGYDTIIHTTDGGDTWSEQDDEQYYNTGYDAVDFIDAQTGWIAGGKILKTNNSGTNWTEQYDPSGYGINAIQFLDENTGWASGGIVDFYNGHFRRVIIHTSDGGNTWETQLYESEYYYTIGPLNDIYFVDANVGWAVGDKGGILHTVDGGDTWVEQDAGLTGYYNELFGVAFTDSNNGWAVGEDGTIIYTTDGGNLWQNYSINNTDDLNSIVFTDSNNGWIAGGGYDPYHGVIYHTSDGGSTWNLQDLGTGEQEYRLVDIDCVDENMGWATGGTFYPWQGFMLHTETGGGDFVYPELAYTPSSIDFGEMYGAQNDTTTITIWNNGTGNLNYYFYPETGCTWITVSPESGFSEGEYDMVTVTIDTGGLQPGEYVCNLTVSSNVGTNIIPIHVTIIESNQILSYSPHYYDFGEVEQNQLVTTNLSIWNSGTGTMFYWIDDAGTFCVVEPWSGSSQGEINNHTINCFTSGLDLGFNQCNLTIYAGNNQTGIVTINVTVIESSSISSNYEKKGQISESNSMNVSIDILPFNPPIYVASAGGTIQFSIVSNNEDESSMTFDIWTAYMYPNSTISAPLYGPLSFTLPSGWSIVNDTLTQYVASDNPSGTYSYISYMGIYDTNIWDNNYFIFEKVTPDTGWYLQSPSVDQQLNAVSFSDAENGWAVGRSNTIIHTSNGGDTWYPMDDGQYYIQDYNDVFFVSDQIGWIIGSKILHTIDGGDTWTEQYDSYTGLYDGFFIDENNGWIVGGEVDFYNSDFIRIILHTSDGGNTWETQLYDSEYYYSIGPLNDVYFIDSTTGWAVGDKGAILMTSDGGDIWVEQDSGLTGYYNELFGVAFTDSNNGWAIGEEGTIIHTSDGGSSWMNYTQLGSIDNLNSIVFADSNNGWIASGGYEPYHSNIYHTSDGGSTWSLQDLGTSEAEFILKDICFIDENMGWATGGTFYPWQGVMVHTENGGGDAVFPELAYAPEVIDFGEMYGAQEDTIPLSIWNNGTGTLNYFVTPESGCTWITVTPEGGFSTGEIDELSIQIDTLGLQPGNYVCNLTITSNDETTIIPVYVTIIPSDQLLSFTPEFIDFGEMEQFQMEIINLSIWNSGTGTMYYWIDDFDTFCVVDPWSGSSQGEINEHEVMCFTSGLDLGFHQCNLTIYAGNNQTQNVTVNVTVIDGTSSAPIEDNNQSTVDRGFPIRHATDGDWGGAQNFSMYSNFSYMSEIYIRKFGSPEFDLTVELRMNGTEGELLDKLIFSPDEIPSTWIWLDLDFQDQIILDENDYYIVIPPAPSNLTTSFGYEWGYAFGNQYDDGSFWFTRDGGNLWRDLPTMYEFAFKNFGYN